MLSLEERKALYSGDKMPKDLEGLRYQYQVMMVTIAPPKSSPRLSESHDKDIQMRKKITKPSSQLKRL